MLRVPMQLALLLVVLGLAACRSDTSSEAAAEKELDKITRDLAPVSDRLAAVSEITDLAQAKREVDRLLVEHQQLAGRVAAIRASSVVSAEVRQAADRLATELATTQKMLDEIARSIPASPPTGSAQPEKAP